MIPAQITLWTMQPRSFLSRLRAGETLRAEEELCMPFSWDDGFDRKFGQAYDWIADRLVRRDPRPSSEPRWPIWAHWSTGSEGPRRPDLRSIRQYQEGVMLELRVDSERVLLSDFIGWHHVLNEGFNGRGWGWFYDAWDESVEGSEERARLRQKMRRSWRRCLAVNASSCTQAVFWEIRPEDVVNHWFYKGYPSS